MKTPRALTSAEAAVLDAWLPEGMTEDMCDVALCLFEALALADGRSGQRRPDAAWLATLQDFACLAVLQLRHLAHEKGGRAIYLAKGVAMQLSARDRQLCAEFRGDNYRQLAAKFGLTEMRVRQILDTWRRELFARQQGRLPGLE